VKSLNFREKTVQIPQGQIFTKTWLPEEKIDDIPVVLLHDSLGCVQMWRDFPAKLAGELKKPVVV
jgi:hypothetical protein